MPANRLAKLPQLLDRKIYKTGQTRGADDDELYQNRVLRSSTVLIPYETSTSERLQQYCRFVGLPQWPSGWQLTCCRQSSADN